MASAICIPRGDTPAQRSLRSIMVPLNLRTRWTAATNAALIESPLLTTDVGMGHGAAAVAASSRVATDTQMTSLATLSLRALSTAAASAAILQRLSRIAPSAAGLRLQASQGQLRSARRSAGSTASTRGMVVLSVAKG